MDSETDMKDDRARGNGQEAEAKPQAAVTGLAARRAKIENTQAYRDLQVKLAGKKCEHCGQDGPWEIVSSPKPKDGEKKIRYLRCFSCGHQIKMASDN